MKALSQWYCDCCGLVIKNAKEGYLEWYWDKPTDQFRGYKILHKGVNSPFHPKENCSIHQDKVMMMDLELSNFTGPDGLALITKYLLPNSNIEELSELILRLHDPNYEEARIYFPMAEADGLFEEANEAYPYLQYTLKEILERYKPSVKKDINRVQERR